MSRVDLKTIERAQRALTRNIAPLLEQNVPQPHAGWLRATRDALGMSRAQMAARMGVTRARIGQIERAEKDQTLKLDTLRRAAEALNCTVAYALVPNKSYENLIADQAEARAAAHIEQVIHTMRLEAQAPTPQVMDEARDKAQRRLIESGRLWDI